VVEIFSDNFPVVHAGVLLLVRLPQNKISRYEAYSRPNLLAETSVTLYY
jgi:hypothetical protein